VWFAEALISATHDEVQRLIAQAKAWALSLHKKVSLWISDKQDAFVTGIAAEFPGVPHRYCDNRFLRDLAKPVWEADSHAKVQMRRKVRGLRNVEQAVLKRQKIEASKELAGNDPAATMTVIVGPANPPFPVIDSASAVVLDYCAAVRGILNDDQGGPLHPPGLRMADALKEVRESIQRWFRLPKSHERRIHGHRHAGVRIVQDGPSLVLALDAHVAQPGLFTGAELLPYRTAQAPPCQREVLNRRKIMRKARSKKKRNRSVATLAQ
jgi:hypothetical protein